MAIQPIGNGYGFLVAPNPFGSPLIHPSPAALVIDAAGESLAFCGKILLSSGPGTSKTLDNTGKIHWRTGSVTFANGSTNLRIGIQDPTSTGINDDSWASEPQADLVGGTDTITANVVNTTPIESGSRSISYGDHVCVVLELTGRGGADSVGIFRHNVNGLIPYIAHDTGSGPAVVSGLPMVAIEFGDGTLGYFTAESFPYVYEASSSFGTGSTPDEHALVFQFPCEVSIVGLFGDLSGIAGNDDVEFLLYSNPLGTPVAERTVALDVSAFGTGGGGSAKLDHSITAYTLPANTKAAVGMRPTTANSVGYMRLNFNSGNGNLRKATTLGTNWSLCTRSDNAGAFGSEDTTILPMFGVRVLFHDGAAAGGGVVLNSAMRGGFVN